MGRVRGTNLPWIVGLVAFPIVGLLFFLITGNAAAAAGVGGVVGVALGVATRFAIPTDSALDSYNADARRRVAKVLESVEAIQGMSGRVKDPLARQALEDGCRRIPELVQSVQAHDPSGVASMAAKLNVTTGGIQMSLAQYLQIQDDPDLYTDAPGLLTTGQQGFQDFRAFVVDTFRQLNDAEVINYKATLAALRPLEIRSLT